MVKVDCINCRHIDSPVYDGVKHYFCVKLNFQFDFTPDEQIECEYYETMEVSTKNHTFDLGGKTMIITNCPECDCDKFIGWDAGGEAGYSPQICDECNSLFWVELTAVDGETLDHESFIKKVAKTDEQREDIAELVLKAREAYNEEKEDD